MFNIGNQVRVKDNLELKFDDEEVEFEKMLRGKIGIITEAKHDDIHPYQVRFDDETIDTINEELGSKLFDEDELEDI